jgi:hypothetical protein
MTAWAAGMLRNLRLHIATGVGQDAPKYPVLLFREQTPERYDEKRVNYWLIAT